MKNFIAILLLFTSISFLGFDCNQININPTPPKPTPVVIDTNLCQNAENHLQDLCNLDPSKNSYCCRVVAPTKKGKGYTQFCQEKQHQGVFLNPKCLSEVSSCDQIDACTNSQ